jgi:hypothetical protein
LHHQGLSQLKQLAAGTEITLSPRLLLKQEGTSKGGQWGRKIQKKASTANKGSESPFNAALHDLFI